mgnify:FL=1
MSKKDSSYTWRPGDKGVIRVSKSTVGAVDWCLQQLWLEKTVEKETQPTEAMTVGNDVHNALEHFYMRCEDDPETVSTAHACMEKGQTKAAFNCLAQLFPNANDMINNGWRDDRDHDQPFYHAPFNENRDWLIRYEMNRMSHMGNLDLYLPAGNELRVETRVTYDVPEYGPTEIQFVGIIDRIFETEEGGLALIELKTGKWSPQKRSHMRREMAYYKFLLENTDPKDLPENIRGKPITHWGWRFPKADKWHYEKVAKRSETAMHRRVGQLISAYLEEDFPTTKQDFKCGYCQYIEDCPLYTPFKEAVA